MFGLSFAEIFIIALVALIVIGPERLPKTARTLGLLVGRAQRYVNDIKTDIEREMHVEDIKKFKDQVAANVSEVKSSVEDEITSISNPIKNISNPLEAVKSEVQDLEKQLKGSLNPLPDLEKLKLDEIAKDAVSTSTAQASKSVAAKAAAVTAGGATSAASKADTVQATTATEVASEASDPAAAPKSQALVDSTVAEAIIYPPEDDAQLASGADVVNQLWSPTEFDESATTDSATSEATSASVNATPEVASIYDGPSFEPLQEPGFDPEEQAQHNERWDALAENLESPVDADSSLEGVGLWEQLPENELHQSTQEQTVATAEIKDNNNSNRDDGEAKNV